MTNTRFSFRAIDPDGAAVADIVEAASRADALRQLTREGKTVLALNSIAQTHAAAGRGAVTPDERVLVLTQLAVMVRAGVDLLEALEIVAGAFEGRAVAQAMRATAAGLRRGERLARALRSAPALSYPDYVYALIGAGEASGRLALVLEEAAARLAFDRGVARDLQNALVYPAFLVASGAASVGFLLYVVVPRFAVMLSGARAELNGLSGAVITAGVWFHAHAVGAVIAAGAVIAGLALAARTRAGADLLGAIAAAVPGLNQLLRTRQRAAWSRIMALSIAAGVDVLSAAELAADALGEGALKRQAQAAIPALRRGRPVDEAFLSTGVLSTIDASLVRAGQRAGAFGAMFAAVADRNERDMRDALKRLTLIVEPVAIAAVAAMIGAIVLGLVSALAGIYDSIG